VEKRPGLRPVLSRFATWQKTPFRRQLDEFLALPGVEIIAVTTEIAERYGILVSQLPGAIATFCNRSLASLPEACQTTCSVGDYYRTIESVIASRFETCFLPDCNLCPPDTNIT
jgi:hypothetical protein